MSCYDEVNVPFVKSGIDQAHRIGKSYTDRASGEKVRSIIIKYKSWESREKFYKARPRNFVNGRRKPGAAKFNVSVDLTKRRYLLLKSAREKVKDNSNVSYVLSDINCSLAIKMIDDRLLFFNSDKELDDLLAEY